MTAKELDALMDKYSVNARQLGEALSYSWNTVRQWRCGYRVINARAAKQIRLYFGQFERA